MGSFRGLAEKYHEARPGYPADLREHLIELGGLRTDSVVLDLGAGTGQLALLMADVANTLIAMDSEPDMVRVGRNATLGQPGIRWVVGYDHEVLTKVAEPVDLVVIGNAFHLLNQEKLLRDLDSLIRPAGMVVICSSSTPVWLQETDWSRDLRKRLSQLLGRPVGSGGVPQHDADVEQLGRSPFSTVRRWSVDTPRMRTASSVIGEVITSTDGRLDDADLRVLWKTLDPYVVDNCLPEVGRTTALIATRSNITVVR